MKSFITTKRTNGVSTITGEQGEYLYQVWNTEKNYGEVSSFEVFIAQNKPSKPSENLIKAIEKAFNENSSVTYNCGNGNQTFSFSEIN